MRRSWSRTVPRRNSPRTGWCGEYADRLDICYVRQPNGGPAAARNTGAAHAHGDFLVIMDSDCIVPPGYFETVYAEVEARGIAFYGGPDMAAPDFSPLQKGGQLLHDLGFHHRRYPGKQAQHR